VRRNIVSSEVGGKPVLSDHWNSWFIDAAREFSVAILTDAAVAGMIGPFPDRIREAADASL
jgi:hypothetical protein